MCEHRTTGMQVMAELAELAELAALAELTEVAELAELAGLAGLSLRERRMFARCSVWRVEFGSNSQRQINDVCSAEVRHIQLSLR